MATACATALTRRIAEMTSENILSVRDLKVTFDTHDGPVEAVRGINLDVKAGETIAVTGDEQNVNERKHFYFEVWKQGIPLNPQDVIVF